MDLISREAALDAVNDCGICIQKILDLPSVQPEPSTDIQDVLGYLDDVLHPLISPDNWNVYSELHDMVSGMRKENR